MDAVSISMSGLEVEWRRLEVIALNLANMNSPSATQGSGYLPLQLVSGPSVEFRSFLEGGRATGVQVLDIQQDPAGQEARYEPDHPMANDDGFVWYPAIDHAAQMTALIRTSRAYEANLTAVSMARQMYQAALQVGRG